MTENDLILHHYDLSPFTQKSLRMMGLKGLSWHSVETPMIMPKPDLTVLTGGYRGTPVLQIGSDIYIDNQRIALELEARCPRPSFFPYGNCALNMAFVSWADNFFRAGLHMVLALQGAEWPEQFLADRKALFSDINFDNLNSELDHRRAQLRAHAALLDSQLSDGRAFLGGDKASLADIHAFSVPWFTRSSMPEVNELLANFKNILPWEERVAEIGEGNRHAITAAAAHGIARQSTSSTEVDIDPGDGQKLKQGMTVSVEPEDSRRGRVSGQVVIATANEIAIRHENETVGEMTVHFPRIGYRVEV